MTLKTVIPTFIFLQLAVSPTSTLAKENRVFIQPGKTRYEKKSESLPDENLAIKRMKDRERLLRRKKNKSKKDKLELRHLRESISRALEVNEGILWH